MKSLRAYINRHPLWFWALVVLIFALVIAHLYLESWLTKYVNKVLNDIPGYHGSISDIDVNLIRGAYRVHDLKINKTKGNMPVPFIDIRTSDVSIQWGPLLRGRIVSNIDLIAPKLNFAVNTSGTVGQNGSGVSWQQQIDKLVPIDINLVTFQQGALTYKDFSASPQVNLYITNMHGEARNLRNVVDADKALPSSLIVRGDSIGKGKLDIRARLNVLRPITDIDGDVKLEHVHLPALSEYTRAYAAFDIKEGTLDVYSEVSVKNGQVSGYVKPIAKKVAILDLSNADNPIQALWQAIVATVVEIFTNQPNDQFATRIPLSGNVDNIQTSTWAAVGGIIRNAFIQAVRSGFGDDEKEPTIDFTYPNQRKAEAAKD